MINKIYKIMIIPVLIVSLSSCVSRDGGGSESKQEIRVQSTEEESTEATSKEVVTEELDEEEKERREIIATFPSWYKNIEFETESGGFTRANRYYFEESEEISEKTRLKEEFPYDACIKKFAYSFDGTDYEIPIVQIASPLAETRTDVRVFTYQINDTLLGDTQWTFDTGYEELYKKLDEGERDEIKAMPFYPIVDDDRYDNSLEVKSIYKVGRYLSVQYGQIGYGRYGRLEYGIIIDTLTGKRVMLEDIIEVDDRLFKKFKTCEMTTEGHESSDSRYMPGYRDAVLDRYMNFYENVNITEKEWERPKLVYKKGHGYSHHPWLQDFSTKGSYYLTDKNLIIYFGTMYNVCFYLPYEELSDILKDGDPRKSGNGESYPIYIVDELDNTISEEECKRR
jgi:lipoprotein